MSRKPSPSALRCGRKKGYLNLIESLNSILKQAGLKE